MEWIYQTELARRAGVSRITVDRAIRRGLIPTDGTGRVPASAEEILGNRRRWAVVEIDSQSLREIEVRGEYPSHRAAVCAARDMPRCLPGRSLAVAEIALVVAG